uniref:NADH-ubiquinone oxidoreductase chain 2 n=1 Tax=Micrambe villosus TaxID=1588241 RepID=A0A343C3A1_9CUCU|nr:NADH dehydrogenase subunit 2 [Micrambe villosus]
MMIGSLISISSYSWFSMWMGLEINLLSIIPLMSTTKNPLSSESALKYFITQAMASSILLFTIIIIMSKSEFTSHKFNEFLMMLINSTFLIKMGAAPFHFWFPEIIEGLSWMNCLIIMTWQKIAPFILLNYTMSPSLFLNIIIICSTMIGGIMGLNQTSLRKILAFSSINHMSWMLSSMLCSISTWLIYFTIYSLITMNIIFMFMKTNAFHISQFFNSTNKSKMTKMFMMMNFLSLGGLPPFLGFFPKWVMINFMVENKFYFTSLIMIMITLITLFFYLRLTFNTMTMNNIETLNKSIHQNKFSLILFNSVNIMGLLICTIVFNFI